MTVLDSNYYPSTRDHVREAKELPQRPDLSHDFSPKEHRAVTAAQAEKGRHDSHRLESAGLLPQFRLTDDKKASQDRLVDPHASAQDKLQAVESLAQQGVKSITVKDADGKDRQCRLEVEKCGNKSLVHMYSQGNDGKEHVVLRGTSNGDGTYSQETDKNGHKVDFAGSWWSSHSEKSALGPVAERRSPEGLPFPGMSVTDGPPKQVTDRSLPPLDFHPSPYDTTRPTDLNHQFDVMSSMARQNGKQLQQLPDGSVYFQAGMAIDADGAPDARRIDPSASRNTSLRNPDGSSVNAREHPYFVLPAGKYQQYGIKPGDIAAVRHDGKVEFAVFADVGPSRKLGEGSMALAERLGINNNPRNGGVSSGVEYIVFPHSGNHTPGSPERNQAIGMQLLQHQADEIAAAYHRRQDVWS